MSHQSTRMFRIKTMRESISAAMKAGANIDEKKFISECCLNFGAGRRYVLEYLHDLENTGFLVCADGKIFTKESFDIENKLDKIENDRKNKVV